MLRRALLPLALLIALAPAAPAAAQDMMTIAVGEMESDSQGTRFTLPVTCVQGRAGTPGCELKAVTSWRPSEPGRWAPEGEMRLLDERPFVVPQGQTSVLDVRVDPSRLRDVAHRSRRAAIVEAMLLDGDALLDRGQVYVDPSPGTGCGARPFVRYRGATLDEVDVVKDTRRRLTSPDIATGASYRVVKGTARFKANGVTYRVSKGSQFAFSCHGVGVVKRGRLFPGIFLKRGKVVAKGRPKGRRQLAVSVLTDQGSLGTRRRERVNLKVTRNRRGSTMHVRRGRSGQITPFKTNVSSPCTSGAKLRIDKRGRIRRA